MNKYTKNIARGLIGLALLSSGINNVSAAAAGFGEPSKNSFVWSIDDSGPDIKLTQTLTISYPRISRFEVEGEIALTRDSVDKSMFTYEYQIRRHAFSLNELNPNADSRLLPVLYISQDPRTGVITTSRCRQNARDNFSGAKTTTIYRQTVSDDELKLLIETTYPKDQGNFLPTSI